MLASNFRVATQDVDAVVEEGGQETIARLIVVELPSRSQSRQGRGHAFPE